MTSGEIRWLRARLGLTVEGMALWMPVSERSIFKWESGAEVEVISLHEMARLKIRMTILQVRLHERPPLTPEQIERGADPEEERNPVVIDIRECMALEEERRDGEERSRAELAVLEYHHRGDAG